MAGEAWRLAVTEALGEVASAESVGGGCIADARIVKLADGRGIFVKTFAGQPDMFRKEANGLREIAKAQAIRVPEVLLVGDDFLVLEQVSGGRQTSSFMETFGRQFAGLHRYHGETFGFFEDNYCGATVQKNTPVRSRREGWGAFYWEHRIFFQYRLAERNGYADPLLTSLMGKLETQVDNILAGSEEPPSILHGDLWSGNYMVGEDGAPVLIDPAAYYGHREADLGMTHLFGNFGDRFYAAYEDVYPLAAGASYRLGFYKLYHVLNHLNLFGRGYYQQAITLIRGYVG